MRILTAEDDRITRRLLEAMLSKWDYQVVSTHNGEEAWEALQQDDAPSLAVLDWSMPKMDGVALCRRVREASDSPLPYLILLTARESKADIVSGLEAGADDYITKPFDQDELRARIEVGARVVRLQKTLQDRVHELEDAMSRIKRLQGLIPICASCKKIRDDRGYWNQLEIYLKDHSEAELSHSLCPGCLKDLYPKFSRNVLIEE